jgi:hypothetical protein
MNDLIAEKLASLVQNLIVKEPHQASGLTWAARPQEFYCEKLNTSPATLRRRIAKPPFARLRALVGGKPVTLLRLGEALPMDVPDGAKRVMIKLWNQGQGKQVTRREASCLWGMTKDIIALLDALLLNEPGERAALGGELAVATFKYAISKEGWPSVMVFVKQRAKELPDGKVRFYQHPSIGVIRRFWKETLYAYLQAGQAGEAKPPDGDEGWQDFVKLGGGGWKLMAVLDGMIWIDFESGDAAIMDAATSQAT